MIYNINLGIGWASSGVEYAQIYRARMFRQIHRPAKFIFMDFISSDNIAHLTQNIGFTDEEVIWLYQYFTDVKIAASSYPLTKILQEQKATIINQHLNGNYLHIQYDNQVLLNIRLKDSVADNLNDSTVESVETHINGYIVQKDYYSYTKQFSEFYIQENNQGKVFQRSWYNEDGSIAYDEFLDTTGGQSTTTLYRFKDEYVFYNKTELIAHFLKTLQLTEKDTLIIDRDEKIGQVILENKGQAKTILIVHADHFAENKTETHYILWNNYYEYMFMNADKIDVIVTSTDAQTQLLKEQFERYTQIKPNQIVTIPVGALTELKYSQQRKPYSLVTVSRLASEKHIDWLVRSVVKAKTYLPELTFDIYGMGGEEQRLKDLITELNAADYIQLMGHHHMEERYKNYQVYIAGSTSEGFGLTLLEAVGSGLGLIGFDVRYGNPTFIKHERNGYLISKARPDNMDAMTTEYAQCIVDLLINHNLDSVAQQSYEIAAPYLLETVAKRWDEIISGKGGVA